MKFFNREKSQYYEKGGFLNTRTIALIVALTAVTVILNPRFSGIAIPSFVPSLWFQIWEIAIVTAFFHACTHLIPPKNTFAHKLFKVHNLYTPPKETVPLSYRQAPLHPKFYSPQDKITNKRVPNFL